MNLRKIRLFCLAALASILSLTALGAVSAEAAPELILDHNNGSYGELITLGGKGFSANATSVSVSLGTVEPFITELVTSANVTQGNFSVRFTVPRFPRNRYTLTAKSNLAGESASISFSITPAIAITPNSGPPGGRFTVSGNGFSSSVSTSLTFDNFSAGGIPTQSDGSFSELAVIVPQAPQGSHSVKVSDGNGAAVEQTYFIKPGISLKPASIQVSDQVLVSGSGFAASSPITFALDNITLGAFVSTNSNGSFAETPLLIPPISSGNHSLKASDNTFTTESATVQVKSSVKIFPPTGTSGTPITVIGFGFGLNRAITLTFAGILTSTSPPQITADANGSFAATLVALTAPAGTFSIAAGDGVNTASTDFVIVSSGSPFQYQGPVKSSIPISGSGFKSGSAVFVTHDGLQLASTIANNSGEFLVNITLPPTPPGIFKVIANDGLNSASYEILVTSSIVTSVNSGNVGTPVKVEGSAFAPSSRVIVKLDTLPVAEVLTDSNGTFAADFKAPVLKGGNHNLEISDGINTVNTGFVMESVPPGSPALIFPIQDANTEPATNLQWSAVEDPSGISYTLQIAHESNFSTLLLEKARLTSPSYQLTDREKLLANGAQKPYFWRVRAVDGASNAGAWSAAQSFIVSYQTPPWVWYAGAAAVAVILFLAGFATGRYLGRRRTKRPQ